MKKIIFLCLVGCGSPVVDFPIDEFGKDSGSCVKCDKFDAGKDGSSDANSHDSGYDVSDGSNSDGGVILPGCP